MISLEAGIICAIAVAMVHFFLYGVSKSYREFIENLIEEEE